MRCTQKEIREKLGITRDTLRFYEQKGIIQPEVDPANGYRYYDDWQVNLLWDCKFYQSMGFSLTEIQQILASDELSTIQQRIQHRADKVEHELERKKMELELMRQHVEDMEHAPHELGRVKLSHFDGCAYVPVRENHGFRQDVDPGAVSFMNANMALMQPLSWFPRHDRDHYYWGYAMAPAMFETLTGSEKLKDDREDGNCPEGFTIIDAGQALETWLDAGDRWNFGLDLFDDLVADAHARGLELRGEICGILVARAHSEQGYHRYLHVFLPVE